MAEDNAEKGKHASTWMQNVLKSKFENTPVKLTPSLREKASHEISRTDNAEEIEILQKIIIRENLLTELNKLLVNHNGIHVILTEVHELVKAIRFQTVDVIEDIEAWQVEQPIRRPFIFRGFNYLTKISTDLAYLDNYSDIVSSFGFRFSGNPLAYIDKLSAKKPKESLATVSFDSFELSGIYSVNDSIEGVDILRIKNAEKTIQRNTEYERAHAYDYTAPNMTKSPQFNNSLAVGEAAMNRSTSFALAPVAGKMGNARQSSNSASQLTLLQPKTSKVDKVLKKKFSALRLVNRIVLYRIYSYITHT